MNLWTIPLADFNESIERARRQDQRLWAAQAIDRFAFSNTEAIPLREFTVEAKNNLTLLERRRTFDT